MDENLPPTKKPLQQASEQEKDLKPKMSKSVSKPLRNAMVEFWSAMTDLRGSAWSAQFGTPEGRAFETWCLFLKNYQPEDIQNGFMRYLESGGGFLDAAKFKGFIEDRDGKHKTPSINSEAYKPWEKKQLEHHQNKEREQSLSEFQKNKLLPTLKRKAEKGCTKQEYQTAINNIATWDSRFRDLVVEGETGNFTVKKWRHAN